ncbi:hypothetical protein BGZ70_002642 [Mortierella alpina]|uniref:FAD-binding domain-containing protein n=1 Tax=Mortierella alpina TaxID=64518 RepID=A0A9P6LX12_MORAP|nr:hypothetical protein BGZ70_002642 [Mortierella alpina]
MSAHLLHSQPLPVDSDGKTPSVVIVGAGLAGLLLGILLDRAGIPYQIYERAQEVRPLGAVMSLNAGIFPVFEQLGLFEELQKISLPSRRFTLYNDDMTRIAILQSNDEKETVGYDRIVFARPVLYDLLLSKISPAKIHLGKKVLSIEQNSEGVSIECSDGKTYHGDILVGADGAYSCVRQGLYRDLQQKNLLPRSDTKEMSKGYICMVGTTDSLEPAYYPGLDDAFSHTYQVLGNMSQYSWSAFSVPGNKICWSVVSQLGSLTQSDDHRFRNSEWGPGSNDRTIKDVRDFLVPFGCTMSDLIDATPREKISSSGQGAVAAMQDAVVLANALYELKSLAPKDIHAALNGYKVERYPHVKEQYDTSKINAKLIYGQASLITLKTRPQATFLPFVSVRGTGRVISQKPSKKYQDKRNSTRASAIPAMAL